MDAETFIADGGWPFKRGTKGVPQTGEPLRDYFLLHSVNTVHWVKVVCWVAIVVMIVWVFMQTFKVAETVTDIWHKIYTKDKFTQKEGLQWLGASADVVRGDYENNQDSLAERAAKRDASVTDMNAKATFMMREKMTPEEEAIKKMGQ